MLGPVFSNCSVNYFIELVGGVAQALCPLFCGLEPRAISPVTSPVSILLLGEHPLRCDISLVRVTPHPQNHTSVWGRLYPTVHLSNLCT